MLRAIASSRKFAAPSYRSGLKTQPAFEPPDLDPNLSLLEAYFASEIGRAPVGIRNYHHEDPVAADVRENATPASVLVLIVEYPNALRVLLTRRHADISYPGQICFPGGRADPEDPSVEATALREAHEEIDLDPDQVRILGRLGDYYTQSGFRITPVVGVVKPPLVLTANPGEVVEMLEIPLKVLTRAASYRIWRRVPERGQAFYALEYGDVRLTGPTVCIAMGFYEALVGANPSVP